MFDYSTVRTGKTCFYRPSGTVFLSEYGSEVAQVSLVQYRLCFMRIAPLCLSLLLSTQTCTRWSRCCGFSYLVHCMRSPLHPFLQSSFVRVTQIFDVIRKSLNTQCLHIWQDRWGWLVVWKGQCSWQLTLGWHWTTFSNGVGTPGQRTGPVSQKSCLSNLSLTGWWWS